jgi:hypothetical protein
MSNFISQSGNIDQKGGNIIFPPSVTHIPRTDGNFFTVPAGLQIRGNRKFIWSIDSFIPGLVAITNERTATPTIEFDSVIFSQPFIYINCTLIGQNSSNKKYILFTTNTSTIYTSFQLSSVISNNNYYSIQNLAIVTTSDYFLFNDPSPNIFYLEWAASNFTQISKTLVNYLIEIWDENLGFIYFGYTTDQRILITNLIPSYRVTPIYENSSLNVPSIFSHTYNDSHLLSSSNTLSNIYLTNLGIKNFSTANSNPFYTSIQEEIILDSDLAKLRTSALINNFSNISSNIFFTGVESYINIDAIDSKIYEYSQISQFTQNQTPNNLFWTQLTGA